MADLPEPALEFVAGGCPDCGERGVTLPPPLSAVGDDFDWRARDYDGLRRVILEELAARFPERRRWTPGTWRSCWSSCWRRHSTSSPT